MADADKTPMSLFAAFPKANYSGLNNSIIPLFRMGAGSLRCTLMVKAYSQFCSGYSWNAGGKGLRSEAENADLIFSYERRLIS